jgi:hypothetical protein
MSKQTEFTNDYDLGVYDGRAEMLEEICQYIESLGEHVGPHGGIPRPWVQRHPGLATDIRAKFGKAE